MTGQKRVLILGGTGDAIELAARATEIPGVEVITSLAGRTEHPIVSHSHTRIGGFGGVIGLTDYLREQQIDLLIDATHPFAAQISFNAAAATAAVGIPNLMLIRPAWEPITGDNWIEVENNAAAARVLPRLAQRIFLAIGRQELADFVQATSLPAAHPLPTDKNIDLWFLMRMIDPPLPDALVPPGEILLQRGPFSVDQERSLLQQYEIGAIVSKNSGGNATYAKIIAARELGIVVVMVQRPPVPTGEKVANVEGALSWLRKNENH